MKNTLIGIAAIAATGIVAAPRSARADNQIEDKDITVVQPAPGRETVRPMKPDWCGAYKSKGSYNSQVLEGPQHSINGALEYDRMPDEGYEDLQQEIGAAACEWPNDPSVQKQVAYWRQLYLNISGMTEAEDRAALKLVMNFDKMNKLQDEQIAKYKDWADQAPDEAGRQLRRMIQPLLFGKNVLVDPERKDLGAYEFFLDTPGRPASMIERVAYVWTCLGKLPPSDQPVRAVARCGSDAKRIDVAAADAEARAMGLNELGRLRVHTYAVAAKAAYASLAPLVAKQDKQAPKFKIQATAADHPEAAYASWDALYAAHKPLFDLGMTAEAALWKPTRDDRADAVLKGDLGHCAAAFAAEYHQIATHAKARSVDDAKDVIADPWTSFVLEHLALCDLAEHKYLDAYAWLRLVHEAGGVPARGPRYALHAQARLDSIELLKESLTPEVADHAEDQLYLELERIISDQSLVDGRNWKRDPNSDTDKAEGTIVAIKKHPDGSATLTFKKERHVWAQEDCRDTDKIDRIDSEGKVEYVQVCTPAAPLVVTRLQDPVTVSADTAQFLKVRQWVQFVIPSSDGIKGQTGKELWGFPLSSIEPAKGKDKPDRISMYGLIPIAP